MLKENIHDENLYVENYYALLACVLNKKLSSTAAINKIMGYKSDNGTNARKKYKAFEVSNIITGEKQIYKNTTEAGKEMGLSASYISTYATSQFTYKKTYKFKYID